MAARCGRPLAAATRLPIKPRDTIDTPGSVKARNRTEHERNKGNLVAEGAARSIFPYFSTHVRYSVSPARSFYGASKVTVVLSLSLSLYLYANSILAERTSDLATVNHQPPRDSSAGIRISFLLPRCRGIVKSLNRMSVLVPRERDREKEGARNRNSRKARTRFLLVVRVI